MVFAYFLYVYISVDFLRCAYPQNAHISDIARPSVAISNSLYIEQQQQQKYPQNNIWELVFP